MANRAYLYSSDRGETEPWEERDNTTYNYCDSRWTIPLAWFFFFDEADVQFIQPVPDADWREIKFRTDRIQALKRFEQRLPVLRRLIDGRYDPSRLGEFFARVSQFSGAYLLLDPEEIFAGGGGDEDLDLEQCRQIIRLTDSPEATRTAWEEAIGPYCTIRYKDQNEFYDHVTGRYYN